MMKTLGSYLIEALEAQGVRHVFGIPGVHNLELYRGLARSRIRHVAGRHEQGLGFMADGYARVSGRPGVCFTITGPGLSNITTAMAQAYGDSIPLLVISSENRSAEIGTGRGFLHEMPEQLGVAARVSGMSRRINAAEELPGAVSQAFARMASGRPRPVYLEIPRDVLAADASGLPAPVAATASRPVAPAAKIAEAARRLREAQSPLILAGGGALGAAAELRQIAEQLDAPVVMTVNARGLLPPDHSLCVPMSPSLEAVRKSIDAADAVLAIGTELGPTDFDMYSVADFRPPANLIRIDIDAEQLERNAHPAVALQADAAPALRSLLAQDLKTAAGRQGGAARAADLRARALAEMSAAMRRQLVLLEAIRNILPTAILVGDSTQPVYAGNLGFAAATPGSWFNSATGYGTLGYALPASTGASIAAPDRPVVCLVGDGGIQFSLGELAVPRDVNAWSAIIVWNNHGYGEIENSMVAVGIDPVGVDIRPPEFSHLARAYGYAHQLIGSVESLERALKDFGARPQVLMLEVRAEAFE
jgi:acetolactate synthase-1/2/3 large subunit